MTLIVVIVVFRDLEAKQLGPIAVRGGGQQALGLDAGLAGFVQAEEVECDVAHQGQIVGDMTSAAAGVVVAELDI